MVELALRQGPTIAAASWLTVLPPAVRVAFYGNAAARAALAPVWGGALSEQALRAVGDATRAALWLGPDEYLLLDHRSPEGGAVDRGAHPQRPETKATAIIDSFEAVLAGLPHALTDISHRQIGLQVSGPHAAAILCGACPLDLDLTEFPVGMCSRTVFAKAEIVLWRTRPDAFHLEVWRSFAGYVAGLLREIATEYTERP